MNDEYTPTDAELGVIRLIYPGWREEPETPMDFDVNKACVEGVRQVMSALETTGWLAAHDAGVRADQAEKDARLAEAETAEWHESHSMEKAVSRAIAFQIRRAAALTPTTEETEQ